MGANSNNIAAYAEGCLYASSNDEVQQVQKTISAIQQSGLTTVILSLFHIGRDFEISHPQIPGDIYYNGTLIISEGKYVGYGSNQGDTSSWADLVASITSTTVPGNTVNTICASIGGASSVIYDFRCIEKIWLNNNKSFEGTNLQQNMQVLRNLIPGISIIDMDNEETDMYYKYDPNLTQQEINTISRSSFVAFCEMCIQIGFEITFCPYTDPDFWTYSLDQLNTSNPGKVKWWNLQCYAGGWMNDPKNWAGYITNAIPGFNTNGFILASDWTRYYDTTYNTWGGDFPLITCDATGNNNSVTTLMNKFANEACVNGGFLWLIDQIVGYEAANKKYNDPCYDSSAASISDYVKAIRSGLTGPIVK